MNGEHGFDLTGSGAEPLQEDDPQRIGPFPLIGRLGSGGMGRVYLGVHEHGYAAVKQVLPSVAGEDKDFLRRFGHELDNLARLPEHATARLIAGDREARPPWFATAYVPGLTLREAVDLHGGPLPAGALWLLLREAAKGLAAVHELGMVHRDVKPSNVMLTVDGVTLIDFGVARAAEQSQLTRTGMVVGTPAYMSPEQASGARRLTGAVDVFALGSVAAYAGCGRPPFGDESGHAVLYRIVHEEPDLEPLRALDAELASVVASCLDKDPEGRPTAEELLDLAAAHAPEHPGWPDTLTERLTERAAFAATPPPTPTPTATTPAPAPTPPPTPKQPEPKDTPDRKRRRTRVLLAVVPIVVVTAATTVVLQLLPYASSPSHGEAGPSASAQVTSTPAPTAPANASPGASPATRPPGTRPPASPTTAPPTGGGTQGGTGASGTTTSGSTNGSTSGTGGTTGSNSNSGSDTGSTTTGTTTGTGTTPQPPPRLRPPPQRRERQVPHPGLRLHRLRRLFRLRRLLDLPQRGRRHRQGRQPLQRLLPEGQHERPGRLRGRLRPGQQRHALADGPRLQPGQRVQRRLSGRRFRWRCVDPDVPRRGGVPAVGEDLERPPSAGPMTPSARPRTGAWTRPAARS
ncbi:serine/threonine protein kinase [Streptomyces sp. Ru71]|nr:serine/threonine protein kinase [Streptomyces sp. Ru71]